MARSDRLTAFACAAIAGILCYYFAKTVRLSVCVGMTAIIVVLISPHFLARPVIFSYVILCVWMCVLMDAYDEKWNEYFPFVLIPLMILWTNIHASYTFGLLVFYIFSGFAFLDHLLRRDFGPLRWIAVLAIGVSAAAFVALRLGFGIDGDHLDEHENVEATYKNGVLPIFRRKRRIWRSSSAYLRSSHFSASACAVPGFWSWSSSRSSASNICVDWVMFCFLVPLILARPAAQRVRYLRAQDPDKVGAADPVLRFLHEHAAVAPAVCLTIAVAAAFSPMQSAEAKPPDSVWPAAALNFVKQAGIKGNVFNSYQFGGYLIFSGIPTFIDGRAQLYGDAFLQRDYNAATLIDIDDTFQMLNDYRIDWAMLSDQPLAKVMARSLIGAGSTRIVTRWCWVRRHGDGADH